MTSKAFLKNFKGHSPVLSYDLGGTKLAVGVVSAQGKILEEIRVPAEFQKGKKAVLRQMIDLGREYIQKYPKISRIGVASAGPLDPQSGVLLDPTNFASAEGNWGKVPLARILNAALKRKVYVENDAAAAILAERWIGAARKYENAMILTLGTGLGTGVICNGSLVRAGRSQHTEAGHLIVRMNDASAPCGCGNLGCAEAFLSGRSFTRRVRARFGNPELDAKAIAALARKKDPRALAAFQEYSEIMAITLHNYIVIYAPQLIVFTGSFSATADLFLDETKTQLQKLMGRRRVGIDLMPTLCVSKLNNDAGLIGAAYIAYLHKK